MTAAYTVSSVIDSVHTRFEQADLYYGHGTDNAWDEAVSLVLTVAGVEDSRDNLELELPIGVVTDIVDLAELRISRRWPLPYILGRCTYMGLEFKLKPGVVVPRSPIGYLLNEGLEPYLPSRVEKIVDLCSGSGCLGILAALQYPGAELVLVDNSELACETARINLELHGLSNRSRILNTDVLGEDVAVELSSADLILCNPPYVNHEDMQDLPAEYRAEPEAGLAAGEDGLDIFSPLLQTLLNEMAAGATFVGEVGDSGEALSAAFPDRPLTWLDLPFGGRGVFVLEARKLTSHTAPASS